MLGRDCEHRDFGDYMAQLQQRRDKGAAFVERANVLLGEIKARVRRRRYPRQKGRTNYRNMRTKYGSTYAFWQEHIDAIRTDNEEKTRGLRDFRKDLEENKGMIYSMGGSWFLAMHCDVGGGNRKWIGCEAKYRSGDKLLTLNEYLTNVLTDKELAAMMGSAAQPNARPKARMNAMNRCYKFSKNYLEHV